MPGRIHRGLAIRPRQTDARRCARPVALGRDTGSGKGLFRLEVRRVDSARADDDRTQHPALCYSDSPRGRRIDSRGISRQAMDQTAANHATVIRPIEPQDMATNTPAASPRFCSYCGTRLNPKARFCHNCGAAIGGSSTGTNPVSAQSSASSTALRWGVPVVAVIGLIVFSAVQLSSRTPGTDTTPTVPLGATAGQAPDISSMSPEERADRLFNRVMRLSSEGKADSAAFFAPMAMGAVEALAPLNAHRRYDMGLIALVSGDASRAAAEADTILAQRPTHLLGLSLAARAAESRGDAAGARNFRRRLLAAEPAERASALPEYADHDADIRGAVELARKR